MRVVQRELRRALKTRALGEQRQVVGCLEILAIICHRSGRREESERLFDEALGLAREIGFGYGEISVLIGLGSLYRNTGRSALAAANCRLALQRMSRSGVKLLESRCLTELALACAGGGRLAEAAGHASRALALARERGQRLAEARALRAGGAIRLELGERGNAREHWKLAAGLFDEIGTPEAAEIEGLLSGVQAQ